ADTERPDRAAASKSCDPAPSGDCARENPRRGEPLTVISVLCYHEASLRSDRPRAAADGTDPDRGRYFFAHGSVHGSPRRLEALVRRQDPSRDRSKGTGTSGGAGQGAAGGRAAGGRGPAPGRCPEGSGAGAGPAGGGRGGGGRGGRRAGHYGAGPRPGADGRRGDPKAGGRADERGRRSGGA